MANEALQTKYGTIIFDTDVTAPDPDVPDQEQRHRESTVRVVVFNLVRMVGEEQARKIITEFNQYTILKNINSQLLSQLLKIKNEQSLAKPLDGVSFLSNDIIESILNQHRNIT